MRVGGILVCLLLFLAAHGQQSQQQANGQPYYSKTYLEGKRKEIQEAINETERQLEDIKKNKNATLSQLKALQNKLAQRQQLINNINDEIGNIDNSIKSSSGEIKTLEQQLESLKVRYAQSIRYSYQTRSSYDMLAFLFSANDFNDALRRTKYLRKFRDFRKQEVDQIRQTQDRINHKITDLNKEKQEKDNLLNSQQQQTVKLKGDVQETNSTIQELKGKEEQLRKEAEKNKKTAARINKAINDIIEREIAEAARKAQLEKEKLAAVAKEPVAPNPKTPGSKPVASGVTNVKPKVAKPETAPLLLTPTDVNLASNFEGNKGKLYWPVDKGYISEHFGIHTDANFKYLTRECPGIIIRTSPDASIRSVFEGSVSSVFSTDGTTHVIVVRHGNYFTVYNGLAKTSVNKGDHVVARQIIGTVALNDEGEPNISFQIWKDMGKKGRIKLDPEQWVGKAR